MRGSHTRGFYLDQHGELHLLKLTIDLYTTGAPLEYVHIVYTSRVASTETKTTTETKTIDLFTTNTRLECIYQVHITFFCRRWSMLGFRASKRGLSRSLIKKQ